METSKINIRPFTPCLKDEDKNGREEYDTLTYGNITIELDQTIIDYLTLNSQSEYMIKICRIFDCGIDEIKNEMWAKIEGKLQPHHRDSQSAFVKDPYMNILHPDNSYINSKET